MFTNIVYVYMYTYINSFFHVVIYLQNIVAQQ